MNLIIIGTCPVKRAHYARQLKRRLCPHSYALHVTGELTTAAWVASSRALIIIEPYDVASITGLAMYTGFTAHLSADGDLAKVYNELNTTNNDERKEEEVIRSIGQSSMPGLSQPLVKYVEFDDGKLKLAQPNEYAHTFDTSHFWQLYDQRLIDNLIHFNIITSTMDYFNDSNQWHGRLIVADQQTRGKGRKDNQWLSPPGSLAMTLGFELDFVACAHPAAIQHIIALALVDALDCPEIRLKWPNDIYWRDEIKLGGLLTKSQFMGESMIVCCGIGLNLTNEKPLTSVATLTNQHHISREGLIARFLTHLEQRIKQLHDGSWRGDYYRRWCTRLDTQLDTYNGTGRVAGLDEDGFLTLRMDNSTKIERFDTDNNSFDLMLGLISRK